MKLSFGLFGTNKSTIHINPIDQSKRVELQNPDLCKNLGFLIIFF
jgi:hypothetical protein